MHDRSELIGARLKRLLIERVQPALYADARALEVSAWRVPGEPVPFSEAVTHSFEPFVVGQTWGAPWSTLWLHVTGTVPLEWSTAEGTPEAVIDLGFVVSVPGFQAEGTAFSPSGSVIKAIESRNQYVPVGLPGSAIDFYIEAAANPNILGDLEFFPTPMGDRETSGGAELYRLTRVDVALRCVEVWELQSDLVTLLQLVEQLPVDLPRRGEILQAMDRAADALDPENIQGTALAARAVLEPVLSSPAYASAHRISAVGHAHIDSAWLWPVRETIRKVARTFSNVLALMDANPDFVFAASSAQQYAWLQQHYPDLYARVKQRVVEGRFVPVGGMWVESDTNMPGGEALARQFAVGKRFFIDELGVEPLEVWLPDSFGYSAALPQIVRAAGSRWFLTQKISWNDTNRMPHHTFWWEGIDGTRVFTHFPPADTYNAELTGAELALAQRQYGEKGAANSSLIPFGYGDGGGGPTREMLASAQRLNDLEGSPRVELESPRQFFELAESEYASPPVWRGELYLEAHRGTYTSQASMKRGNRRSEHSLREAELWAATRSVRLGDPYPYAALASAWRTVLLQQFHDILPGSSIAWVHKEADRNYAEVAADLDTLIRESMQALVGHGAVAMEFNAGPYARAGVPALSASPASELAQVGDAHQDGDQFILENSRTRATIDANGLLVSLLDLAAGREAIPAGSPGNLLQLFRDTPTLWDAWDIDSNYTQVSADLVEADSVEVDGASVIVSRSFGASTVVQVLQLNEESGALDITTRVDWHERQKLLKLAFPLDVYTDRATSEIQFGHIHRPTHANTSWDAARFETVAHRWVHVGEAGFGVAIANDSIYGHDIRSVHASGRGTTVVRLSLLRAPLYPDPETDQGTHQFTVSVLPAAGIADAVELGYRLNLPARRIAGARGVEPLVVVDNPAVVVEAIKLAEDGSGDVIVRLYEAYGSRARARVTIGFDVVDAVFTDLLERRVDDTPMVTDNIVALDLRQFQIVTLRLSRSGGGFPVEG